MCQFLGSSLKKPPRNIIAKLYFKTQETVLTLLVYTAGELHKQSSEKLKTVLCDLCEMTYHYKMDSKY